MVKQNRRYIYRLQNVVMCIFLWISAISHLFLENSAQSLKKVAPTQFKIDGFFNFDWLIKHGEFQLFLGSYRENCQKKH